MSQDTRNPAEFRRYRQGLTTLYLVVVGCGGLLLTGSVLTALFLRSPKVELTGPIITADNPNPQELLTCNRDVARLLGELSAKTVELMGEPTARIDRQWTEFKLQWGSHYDEVEERCRFAELAKTNLGTAYDRMASVHGDLPAMRLKYQGLLVRFDEEQADELGRMTRALDLSYAALKKRGQEQDDRRDYDGRGTNPGPRTN